MSYLSDSIDTDTIIAPYEWLTVIRDFVTGLDSPASWELTDSTTDDLGVNFCAFRVPGYAGHSAFYAMIQVHSAPESDNYGLWITCSIAYDPADKFLQSDRFPDCKVPLSNLTARYHLFANAQRLVFFSVGTSVVESGYMGRILSYATVEEYPAALFVGSSGATNHTHMTRADNRRLFTFPSERSGASSRCFLRWVDGSIIRLDTYGGASAHKFQITQYTHPLSQTQDGKYLIQPLTLYQRDANVIGAFDGVYQVTGHNNQTENIIPSSEGDLVVFQNVYHTDRTDYIGVLDT